MKFLEKITQKKLFILLKNTFLDFLDYNCIKLSASLSYYTIFALPSLAILVISLVGLFYDASEASSEFFYQLSDLVGKEPTAEIQAVIQNISFNKGSIIARWVGGVTLIFSASAIFAEIQSSINYIWELKANPQKGFLRIIINRLLSFAMIGALGFVLLVSLIINTSLDLLFNQLIKLFSEDVVFAVKILNYIIVFMIISVIFGFIFKTLPDGKLRWKDTLVGSCVTSVLFMQGKLIIGNYLVDTAKLEIYGGAGSIMILLVWVYYSAIILYFGAVFTKNYSEIYGTPIEPTHYAVRIISSEKEVSYAKSETEIQEKNNKTAI